MIMNFIVMPLYFLSGAMFPINSAPDWMKTLMVIDPLSYGVDAIRNIVFSDTMVNVGQGVKISLAEMARQAGLIRWDLTVDIAVMAAVAVVLANIGSLSFSKTE